MEHYSEDAFGFGIFAPFVPVLAKSFQMTARNIAGAKGCIANDLPMVSSRGNWIRIKIAKDSAIEVWYGSCRRPLDSLLLCASGKPRHAETETCKKGFPWFCHILPYLILFDVFFRPPSLLQSIYCHCWLWERLWPPLGHCHIPWLGIQYAYLWLCIRPLWQKKGRKVAVSNQHKHRVTRCAWYLPSLKWSLYRHVPQTAWYIYIYISPGSIFHFHCRCCCWPLQGKFLGTGKSIFRFPCSCAVAANWKHMRFFARGMCICYDELREDLPSTEADFIHFCNYTFFKIWFWDFTKWIHIYIYELYIILYIIYIYTHPDDGPPRNIWIFLDTENPTLIPWFGRTFTGLVVGYSLAGCFSATTLGFTESCNICCWDEMESCFLVPFAWNLVTSSNLLYHYMIY